MGFGPGWWRGWKRERWLWGPWFIYMGVPPFVPPPEEEKRMLLEYKKFLEEELKHVEERLKELENA